MILAIPILSDAVNLLRTGIDNFVRVVPNVIKIILFIFILVFVGDLITGFILEDKYQCEADFFNGNKTTLYDSSQFFACNDHMTRAWLLKVNASEEIQTFIGTQNLSTIQSNLSASRILFLAGQEGTLAAIDLLSVSPIRSRFGFNIYESFLIWNPNKTFDNFKDVFFGDPRGHSCRRLALCLDEDARSDLGLSLSCGIDDVPEWDEWFVATRKNLSEANTLSFTDLNDDKVKSGFNPFFVSCSRYEGNIGSHPRIVFLGFDFLNVKQWFLLFLLGGIFTVGYKYWRHTGVT